LRSEIGHEALQVHDSMGSRPCRACRPLAGVGCRRDPQTDGRGFPVDELEGFLVLADGDEGHITLDADMGRAGRLAGRRAKLVNGISAWGWPGGNAGRWPLGH